MKRVILTVLVFVILCGTATAATPLIMSNAQAGVIGYQITGAPGGTFPDNIAAQQDGSLRYDTVEIPSGTYALKVAACNMWGCGETASLNFTKSLPGPPAGLRISVQ